MDEGRYIDWYEVVEAVANGREANLACPECGAPRLEVRQIGARTRVRCPDCGQGVEGDLRHGRDDAFNAAAEAMMARQDAARAAARAPIAPAPQSPGVTVVAPPGGVCATPDERMASLGRVGSTTRVTPGRAEPARPSEPWEWSLPAQTPDVEALSMWTDVIEAIHNGRRVGLRCPYCSEPLDAITEQPPFLRVACTVCGEMFEGRLG